MDEVNITYITLNGYVEMNRLKYLYFTVMLMVYILIFLCNGTVFYIICFHKNLHEPMYIFIAALLFNSVVYNCSTTIKIQHKQHNTGSTSTKYQMEVMIKLK
uniref:G-protein coupled receptors family 1 profile domain-containing protein n=1 Tax=Poecilia latipinna TaxID=48699 RepID=A0A3B3UHQ7_9TELE